MRVLLVLFSFILATSGHADTLVVRGGEHDDFTRLTVPLFAGANWSLNQRGRQFVVRVNGARFDLRQAFNRIRRERVASLSVIPPDAMLIDLACDCQVQAEEDGALLILDVGDRPRPTDRILSLPVVFPAAPSPLLLPFKRRISSPVDETRLVESIARAAGEGLLSLSEQPLPEIAQIEVTPGLEVRSDYHAALGLAEVVQEDCLPSGLLNPANWGGTGSFLADTTLLRTEMGGERDRIDPEIAERLAWVYLYYGLSDEVFFTTSLFETEPEKTTLRLLAEIQSGDAQSTTFEAEATCSEFGAFWAFLAGGSLNDAGSIEWVFRDLPDEIQNRTGPVLVMRLVGEGQIDSARRVLSNITGESIARSLAEIALLRSTDRLTEAYEEALSLLQSSRPQLQIASVFVELALATNQSQTIERLTYLSSIVHDWGDDGAAYPLRRGLAQLWAQSGNYKEAFDLLKNVPDHDDAMDAVVRTFVEAAPDMDFLRISLSDLRADLPDQAQELIRQRLVSLGFVEEPKEQSLPAETESNLPNLTPFGGSLADGRSLLDRSNETRQRIASLISADTAN